MTGVWGVVWVALCFMVLLGSAFLGLIVGGDIIEIRFP